jgi:hypothetical protein
LPYFVNNPKH